MIKVPFQFKVASIIATDQVEILGTTININHPNANLHYEIGSGKEVSYDILSRVVHNDKFKSFKALGVRKYHFKREYNTNNILIPKVGIKFEKAGTYIIESNFNIKLKNRDVKYMYLNYIHNTNSYIQYNSIAINTFLGDEEVEWSSHMRFDVQYDDTLDIKLCAIGVNYEDIF